VLRFGRCELIPGERLLRVDGQPAAIGARAFDLLLALVERRGRLVGKQELLDVVWPGLVVEEHNIAAQVSSLRKLLGAQAIATVPGRGYRFVAPLELSSPAAAAGAWHDVSAPPARQAPPAAPGAPAVGAPATAETPAEPRPRHNLPEPRTRFIGREAALADLARLLPQTRLLTLTGIGGCGKTRLALQFARQQLTAFPDGAWFVDLTALKSADRVAAACAVALGFGSGPDAPSAERVAAQIAARRLLVVLDNCEHVREGAAALADALLSQPGPARLLATSREPLSVAGEQLYPVRPLSLPAGPGADEVRASDAVRVFVDRARLVQPGFDVDAGNAAAVAEVCARLDGIALAIEMAAARVPVLPVPEIAARLNDRFRLLAGRGGGIGGSGAAAAHQQTLLATMQWSHDLLEPAQQRLLRRLAVCAGGCTLAAAAAIGDVADEYEALALLGALHDKSLLVVEGAAGTHAEARARPDGEDRAEDLGEDRAEDRSEAAGGQRDEVPPRYRMLETVAQYAQQRLHEAGEADAARARHAAHFLALAEQAAPHLRGPQQSLWMQRLRAEQENLVAAFAWYAEPLADHGVRDGLRLAAATARYWVFNEIALGWRLLNEALARDAPATPGPARLHALLGLASLATHGGQGDAGLPHAREALAIAERLGSTEWQAMAMSGIGTCLSRASDEAAALEAFERALELAQAAGAAVPMAAALNNIAGIRSRRGQWEAAEQGFRRALHVARAQGDARASLIFLHNLVRVSVARRQPAPARAWAAEAARLLRGSVADEVLKLELLEVGAGIASIEAQHAQAARLWGATVHRFDAAGYSRPPEDQLQLERLLAATREALGDAAFAQAQAVGRAWSVDAAMRELVEWLRSDAAREGPGDGPAGLSERGEGA